MGSRGKSKNKRHRATVTIGRAKLVFTRPIATGHFGHKREVREGAAQDAWEYLVSSDAILGTGYFVDQQQHPMSTARVDQGRLLVDHYGQSQNSLLGANRVAVGGDRNSDSQNSPRSPRCLTTAGGLRAAARPHASTNSSNLVRSDGARSSEVRGPKSPSIHPARLQMLQHATPIDDQTMQSCSLAALGLLNSGANVAPLGRKRPGFEKSSCTTGPHPELAMTDSRLNFSGPLARSLPAPPAFQAKQTYLPQQKRVVDQFDGNIVGKTVAKRQKMTIRGMGARNYATIRDGVEEFVQGIKEEVI